MPAVGSARGLRTPLLLGAALAAALAAEPAAVATRKAHARSLLENEDFTAALAEAEAANRAAPDDVGAYGLIAAAQLGLGNYAEAEKQLQWMLDLRIGKADLPGWVLVARFREATGDVEGALDALNLANGGLTAGQPDDRRALMAYAAKLYYGLGKLELAAASAEAAGAEADQTLARIRTAQGRRAEAIRILRGLTERNSDPRALYLLAETSGAAADYGAFEQAALHASAASRNANRELILYYAGRGHKAARALELARREAQRRHDIFTLDALAVALLANRHTNEARETMQRALGVGTRDPAILRHAARMGVKTP